MEEEQYRVDSVSYKSIRGSRRKKHSMVVSLILVFVFMAVMVVYVV